MRTFAILLLTLLCCHIRAAGATDHFVAPNGAATGDGSIGKPWDLDTAIGSYDVNGRQLSPPAAVRPGDTLWLRGGTYRSNSNNGFVSRLQGTASSPIIVRNYNGERVTIDGGNHAFTLASYGSYTWFWGIELTSSAVRTTSTPGSFGSPLAPGAYDIGPNNKWINMIVHDTSQGFSSYDSAPGGEYYGNLSYYNGWIAPDRNHGHGMYMHNISGTKLLEDNIVGDNADEGLQIYGSGAATITGFIIDHNALYNTTSWPSPNYQYNFLLGGGNTHANIVDGNYSYMTPSLGLGYIAMGIYTPSGDYTITNNIFVGGQIGFSAAGAAGPYIFTGNTVFVDPTTNGQMVNLSQFPGQNYSSYKWDRNTYYGINRFYTGEYNGNSVSNGGNAEFAQWQSLMNFDTHGTFSPSAPKGRWIFVRPNKYEKKRANIIIYNWDLSSVVAVDLSSILAAGDEFVIQDAQNYFGPAVVSGTYSGGTVAIPMTGLTKAVPSGFPAPRHTAPAFGTFIVMAAESSAAPLASPINLQVTVQ